MQRSQGVGDLHKVKSALQPCDFQQANLFLVCLPILLQIFAPSRVSSLDLRILKQPLVVSQNHTSPPAIAFETVFKSSRKKTMDSQLKPPFQALEGNVRDSAWVAEFILKEQKSKKFILPEMSISKSEFERPTISKEAMIPLLATFSSPQPPSENIKEDQVAVNGPVAGLITKRLPSSQGGSIIISGRKAPSENVVTSLLEKKKSDLASLSEGRLALSNLGLDGVSSLVESLAGYRNITFTGPLEMTGGLAYTNDMVIDLRRYDENGLPQEAGKFHLDKGQYEITVGDMNGYVTASLMDSHQRVLGRGSLRISDIKASLVKSQQVDGINITMKPYTEGVSGQVISAYSFEGYEKPIESAKVELPALEWREKSDKNGQFEFEDVADKSTVLVSVQYKGYYPSQELVVAGAEAKLLAFPDKMINAFWDLVSDLAQQKGVREGGSIVWGRVTIDGQPQSGVVVQTENAIDVIPIYFNRLLIPDPKLKATSENGLFAFVNLESGFHSLIAMKENHYFSHGNVLIENGKVSIANLLQSSKIDPVDVKVFDGLTGSPASAELMLQSLEEPHKVKATGVSKIFLPSVDRLSFLRVIPEDEIYSESLHTYLDSNQFLHVPLIRTSWLKGLKATAKIDDGVDNGLIVGFVQSDDFEVYLTGHKDYKTTNIAYFDGRGQILKNSRGVKGGGFVLFNVPLGPHHVVLMNQKSHQVQSQVTAADAQGVSVLRFGFQ